MRAPGGSLWIRTGTRVPAGVSPTTAAEVTGSGALGALSGSGGVVGGGRESSVSSFAGVVDEGAAGVVTGVFVCSTSGGALRTSAAGAAGRAPGMEAWSRRRKPTMPTPTTAATARGRTQRGRRERSGGSSASLVLSGTRGRGVAALERALLVNGASLAAPAPAVAMLGAAGSVSATLAGGMTSGNAAGAGLPAVVAGVDGSTGAMPNSVCLRSGPSACGGEEATAGVAGGAARAAGAELDAAAGGSERGATTGAMPSSVCLRRGLPTTGVAVASGLLTMGVAVADDGSGACATGTDARATGGAEDAGRGAAPGDEAGRGDAEERATGTGVGKRAAGVEAGAAVEIR